MTTTNQTPTGAKLEMPEIPANLKRTASAAPVAAAPVAPAPKPDKSSKPIRTTPAKQAKPAKAKATAKPAAKTPHRKTAIKATEANPAKSIVPMAFKQRYADHNDSCGDKVSTALKAATEGVNADGRPCLDLAKLANVAKANGIDPKVYEHLNNGQKRMNVGNKLRGLLKAGKTVTIGSQKFADAAKALAKPAPTAEKPKAKATKRTAKPAPAQAAA